MKKFQILGVHSNLEFDQGRPVDQSDSKKATVNWSHDYKPWITNFDWPMMFLSNLWRNPLDKTGQRFGSQANYESPLKSGSLLESLSYYC